MNPIQHIAILKDSLMFRDGLATADARSAGMALEQLPYCLDAALTAAFSAMDAARAVGAAHETELQNPNFALWMTESERNSIAFQIDRFLEAAVRTQNALVPYFRRAFRKSFPDSFNKLMQGIAEGKYNLPPAIVDQLNKYWLHRGKKLRAYRDLSQHYSLVTSEGTLRRQADGLLFMYLALPNNPDVKNIKDLSFVDPVIHALPYALDEAMKLLAIVFRVTDLLLPRDVDRNIKTETTVFRDPGMSSISKLHNIPAPDMERGELEQCLARQVAWSASWRGVASP